MKKAALLLAGIALAGTTTVAFAAKPAMTHQEKQELAAKAKKVHAANVAKQPRTSGQAKATLKTERGVTTALVPTVLWTTLAVADENGKVRIVEADGTKAPTTEGLPNE